MGIIRFMAVAALTFLLLGVLIRQLKNEVIKPTLVLVADNSTSISRILDEESLQQLGRSYETIAREANRKSYHFEIRDIKGNPIANAEEIDYSVGTTDLSTVLKNLENEYEGRNLAGIILASDGIYNQGVSPAYNNFGFPIHTIGLGDTTQKSDIILKALYHNKIVYQGNRFPVIAEFTAMGFNNRNLVINLKRNNQLIQSVRQKLPNHDGLFTQEFIIEANLAGLQRYSIDIEPLEGEFSLENNSQDAYVEVVEGKEKILLLAHAPHPDIKAISRAIEKNENYELVVVLPGINPFIRDQYDLAILHQIPDNRGNFSNEIAELKNSGTPLFYIIGSKSNIKAFNDLNSLISISSTRNQKDNVFPSFDPDFSLFDIDNDTKTLLGEFPPVDVPFGDYQVKGNADHLLLQRVGRIVTEKPLLSISRDRTQKEGVLLGEGSWTWRLFEYKSTNAFKAFDDIIGKTIQYLSAKEDKRKFRVYPINNENSDNTPVTFETEIYNDLYEKMYDQQISLSIRDEKDSVFDFSYIITEANSKFRLSGLQAGVYRFRAEALVNDRRLSSEGMFSVRKQEIENVNLTADHQLLRELSRRSGGGYYKMDNIETFLNDINASSIKSIIYSSENYLAVINMKWIFFILIFLFTIEWGLRKFFGGY